MAAAAGGAGEDLTMVPGFLETLTGASTTAGTMITTAATCDASAMTGAVMAAMGPIGVPYVAGYAPAQASNLACSTLVGTVHVMTGGATELSKVGYLATDAVDL